MAETQSTPSLREWVMVPREATKAMSDAGWAVSEAKDKNWESCTPRQLWTAMVAAAPTPPTILTEAVAAARAEGVREGLERAADWLAPNGPRPCDCERCDCGNVGDLAEAAAWDADNAASQHVRALIPAPPTTPGGRTDG